MELANIHLQPFISIVKKKAKQGSAQQSIAIMTCLKILNDDDGKELFDGVDTLAKQLDPFHQTQLTRSTVVEYFAGYTSIMQDIGIIKLKKKGPIFSAPLDWKSNIKQCENLITRQTNVDRKHGSILQQQKKDLCYAILFSQKSRVKNKKKA